MSDEINLDDSMDEILDELEKTEDDDAGETETAPGDIDPSEGDEGGEGETEGEVSSGEPEDDKTPEPAPEPVDPSLELPPTGWDGESKSKYAELPAWAKRQIHKREQDGLRGVSQLKQQIQATEGLQKAAEPYRAYLRSKNLQLDRVVSDALNLAYSLETASPQNKAAILRNLAQQFGADMTVLGQQPDPAALQQQQAIAPIMTEVQQLRQALYGRQEAEQRQQTEQALQAVEQFRNQTDEKGQPKYPFFDRVQDDMALLIESGRATTLEQAYDKAVWTDPDIRQLIQKQQNAEAEAKRQEAAKAKAAKAQKNARVNLDTKGQSDAKARKPTGTIDDTMDEILDRMTA